MRTFVRYLFLVHQNVPAILGQINLLAGVAKPPSTPASQRVQSFICRVARGDKQWLAAARLVCTQFRCLVGAAFAGGIAARRLPTPQWLVHFSSVANVDLRQAAGSDTAAAMSSQEWKHMASLRPDLTRLCLPIQCVSLGCYNCVHAVMYQAFDVTCRRCIHTVM